MTIDHRARHVQAALAALIFLACGDSGESDPAGAGGSGDTTVREGAPVGAECRARSECGETTAEAITCGCTGEQDVPQCTPFGHEGEACDSYGDQVFDLKHPLCGPGLRCAVVPETYEGVCERLKGPGEACTRGQCQPGSSCLDGVCAAPLPLGAPCVIGDDQPCASPNHCTSGLQGTCVAPLAIGEACESRSGPNNPCAPGAICPSYVVTPDTFTCRPGGRRDGEPCSDSVQCVSGVCQQSTCGLKACQRASPATP